MEYTTKLQSFKMRYKTQLKKLWKENLLCTKSDKMQNKIYRTFLV